uniref:tRNA(Ile)-lysidine synthase n=1 Tax=Ahnfeltia fastigiata TaxID=31363 RepID=UPI001D10E7D9|nr:tRNA(Ile)-lysidine synthase [Ahnfeltia fastigiata]UAT97563.1 tRNA(Ile)-lysidine synthase [Ahnfeltia fastigiata]
MPTIIHKKFQQNLTRIIDKRHLQKIIVTVSGGQDSLCLIKLVIDLQKKYNWHIEVIYIDHQWRNDSQKNTKHIINFIQTTNLNLSIYQIKHVILSEVEARNLRYKIFLKHAKDNEYKFVMTAHTETDRIETFLQQIIRGTSIDGATSLTWNRQIGNNIQIIRPLLNFSRGDITWFCRKYHLPIWSDTTNYEYNIQRNRLRNELLPYIKQYFLHCIDKHITSFLEISNQDNEYIKQNAIKLYLISRHNNHIGLNCLLIREQHLAIQARTLQLFFYYHFNKSINKNALKQVILLVQQHKNKIKLLYWENLKIYKDRNWLYVY